MPSANFLTTREHTYTSGESGFLTTKFSAPAIDYINQTDIEVERVLSGSPHLKVTLTKVDSAPGTDEYTLDITGSLPIVTLGLALSISDTLKVRRKTARGRREVDFVQGSTLTEADLDKATKQGIYLAEEAIDRAKSAEDEAIRIGGGEAADLPASGAPNNILSGLTETSWESITLSQLKTDLAYGSSADVNLGASAGEIPVNPSGASDTLGLSAYKDTGTSDGDVPLNSDLGTIRTLDVGVGVDNVIQLEADGEIPTGVKGSNLANLNRPSHVTIRQAYLSTGNDNTSGSAWALTSSLVLNQWHVRPLNEKVIHPVNGTSDDFGITLTLPLNADGAIADGGVGSEINFTEEGTYEVEILSSFYEPNNCTSRFVDLNDTIVGDATIVQGSTCRTQGAAESGVSTGRGVFVIGSASGSGIGKSRPLIGDNPDTGGAVTVPCRRFQLQFAWEETTNPDLKDSALGPMMSGLIKNTAGAEAIYMTNVFAWVDIKKIA